MTSHLFSYAFFLTNKPSFKLNPVLIDIHIGYMVDFATIYLHFQLLIVDILRILEFM